MCGFRGTVYFISIYTRQIALEEREGIQEMRNFVLRNTLEKDIKIQYPLHLLGQTSLFHFSPRKHRWFSQFQQIKSLNLKKVGVNL